MSYMLVALMVGSAAVGQPGGSARVAVVSIPAVSEKYRKTVDLEGMFEQTRVRLAKRREEMQDKLDRMKRSLQEELKPGTEAFDQRRKEIATLEAEMQWFIETKGRRIEEGLAGSLREIYEDIRRIVVVIAEENSIDIVLASDRLPDSSAGSAAQVRQQILLQKVIYWSPQTDITDKVIDRLNATYEETKNATATVPNHAK